MRSLFVSDFANFSLAVWFVLTSSLGLLCVIVSRFERYNTICTVLEQARKDAIRFPARETRLPSLDQANVDRGKSHARSEEAKSRFKDLNLSSSLVPPLSRTSLPYRSPSQNHSTLV